jgi:WD40 repeat protein
MPRGERPVEGEHSGVVEFAAGLRELRVKAGSPTYRVLAGRAHYSAASLSEAASGKRLPSLAVALAYVRACGGDTAEWERRWEELARQVAATNGGGAAREDADSADDSDLVCPYRGLATFQVQDAGWFFGRDELSAELADRVRTGRFLAVFGPSGAGKSSLLRAGLVPRLQNGPGRASGGGAAGEVVEARVTLFQPGPHPLHICAVHVAAAGGGTAAALCRELADDPVALHLGVLQALASEPPGTELVLVVDQFEEVFTLCSDASERARFIAALLAAAQAPNSRARVVLGVRADFYGRCAEHPELVAALRDAQVLVGPMSAQQLREAVTQPAVAVGCQVESALAAQVVADAAGQPAALPLVSHALRETWGRRRGNTLTLAGYQACGGVRGALANSAEALYTDLAPRRREVAHDVLLRLVALGDSTKDTKRPINRDDLPADDDTGAVIDTLAAHRLITLDTSTVELAHEALLDAWPRLAGWLAEDRASLLMRAELTQAAAAWQRGDRDPALLYRGSRLAAATEWAAQPTIAIPDDLAAFLTASTRARARAARLRQAGIAAVTVFALLASIAAIVAFQQRATAKAETQRAIVNQVTAEADRLEASDASLSAQLNLVAYRLRSSPAQQTDLAAKILATQHTPLSTPLSGHTDGVNSVAFSPNGHTVASGSNDRTVRLWYVTDPAHAEQIGPPLTGHQGIVNSVAFSPNGHTLASGSDDKTVRLWDVTDPTHAHQIGAPLTGHTDFVASVAFSPDGHTLASGNGDGTVRLWDVADPTHTHQIGPPLTSQRGTVYSVAFSPDRHTLASGSSDGTVRLWDVSDASHARQLAQLLVGHASIVLSVAFSPDERTLASASVDKEVRLWDVTDPAHAHQIGPALTGHTGMVTSVAFSPDGRTLASASMDKTIRRWDVADAAHAHQIGPPLTEHTAVGSMAFSPGGHTLASTGDDYTVLLWNLGGTPLTDRTNNVYSVAYSPDRHTLASGGDDGTARLWDITDPTHTHQIGSLLTGGSGVVYSVAFSPDGHTLASGTAVTDGNGGGTVRLWDITDPAHIHEIGPPLVGHAGIVASVAFSPDGHTLASGSVRGNASSSVGTLGLWDITDPTNPRPIGPPLADHADNVYSVAFSPDGRTLASGHRDGTVRLWDLADPAHAHQIGLPLTGQKGVVYSVAFSPDGRTLASGSDDKTVRLWDVSDAAHAHQTGPPLTGHTGLVESVAFSPDRRTLASGSIDGTVRLWDVADPTHAHQIEPPLTGHTDAVTSVAFSPDGRTLASASKDQTILLWDPSLDHAIRRICAATANTLTPAAWARYVSPLPYNPPCASVH